MADGLFSIAIGGRVYSGSVAAIVASKAEIMLTKAPVGCVESSHVEVGCPSLNVVTSGVSAPSSSVDIGLAGDDALSLSLNLTRRLEVKQSSPRGNVYCL